MNQEQMAAASKGIDDTQAMAEIYKGLERLEKMNVPESAIMAEPEEEENQDAAEAQAEEQVREEVPPEEIGEEDLPPHSPDAVKPEDDILDEEKSKPKIEKAWKLKKAIHRERSEKYALRAEIEELRKQLSQSLDIGSHYYEKGALADLEMAKERKNKAMEVGDKEAFIEADIAINRALLSLHELQKSAPIPSPAAPTLPVEPLPSHNEEHELQELHSNIVEDWIENHSYLQPASSDYDAALATKVMNYAKKLDRDLTENRKSDLIFSEQYFDRIDGYIEGIRTENAKRARDLAAANHIGGVRGATPAVRRAAPRGLPPLTEQEKRMCLNMGIPQEVWKKQKEQNKELNNQ